MANQDLAFMVEFTLNQRFLKNGAICTLVPVCSLHYGYLHFLKWIISTYFKLVYILIFKFFFFWKAKKICRLWYSWISSTRNIILEKGIYTFHFFFNLCWTVKGWKIESYAPIRSTNMSTLAMLYDDFSEL
jgi:hypothetical protein